MDDNCDEVCCGCPSNEEVTHTCADLESLDIKEDKMTKFVWVAKKVVSVLLDDLYTVCNTNIMLIVWKSLGLLLFALLVFPVTLFETIYGWSKNDEFTYNFKQYWTDLKEGFECIYDHCED